MRYAEAEWFYDFRELPSRFAGSESKLAIQKLRNRYAKITKSWSVNSNSEWLCRNFVSAKLIMFATLSINSMHYAEGRNLRVVVPYLRYYSFLSIVRSLVLTIPEHNWDEGHLIQIGHTKAINLCVNHIKSFDKEFSKDVESLAFKLKAARELVSYRAPTSGDVNIPNDNSYLEVCSTLCELAQLNSEILEKSIQKNAAPDNFIFLPEVLISLANVEIDGHVFSDSEDAYRLDYFLRKCPNPTNLMLTMTEGHVEDFFGAWGEESPVQGSFDPDECWGMIFDVP